MTNTISTYAVFQSTLADVSNTESQLTSEQEQLSSGNAAQNFAGMADQAQQYLSLNATISRTNQYLNNNQIIEARVSTTSSVLGQVITTANSLQSLISQQRTGVSDSQTGDNKKGADRKHPPLAISEPQPARLTFSPSASLPRRSREQPSSTARS